jgi:Fe2+ or Zn2+ uptake regulation protein
MTPAALDTNAFRQALESAGLRVTPQRAAVYDSLRRAEHHPTAEEVYRSVQRDVPHISLATVYKALETLVERGLASRLHAADASGPARYDARTDHHYHLRCVRSGAVEDLPTAFDPDLVARIDPDLDRLLAERGFHVTSYRLELVGYFDDPPPAGPPSS